ncbi:hypothetical protein ACLB2K_034522 [Fragaria x ananassa]
MQHQCQKSNPNLQYSSAPATFATTVTYRAHRTGANSTIPPSSPTYHAYSSSFSSQPYPHQPNVSYQASPVSNPYSSFPQQQTQGFGFDPNLLTMKQVRLEFSSFKGGDPVEWLNKCEQIVEFYQIPEGRKLSLVVMHLSGKASNRWYMFRHEFPQTWQGLADLLMREFSSYNRAEYQASLARMDQTGTVEQFMEEFTRLSRRALAFSHELLVTFFIEGLKEEIIADVQALKPTSLYEACELARVFESRNNNLRNRAKTASINRFSANQSSVQLTRSSHSEKNSKPNSNRKAHSVNPKEARKRESGHVSRFGSGSAPEARGSAIPEISWLGTRQKRALPDWKLCPRK